MVNVTLCVSWFAFVCRALLYCSWLALALYRTLWLRFAVLCVLPRAIFLPGSAGAAYPLRTAVLPLFYSGAGC
jgi:hypothetical protein